LLAVVVPIGLNPLLTTACPRPPGSAEATDRKATGAPCSGIPRSDPAGIVHVHDFTTARTVLRSRRAVQAGFGVEAVSAAPLLGNLPIVYLDGDAHHRQRRWTARLFAPAVVQARQRPFMEEQAAALADELARRKRVDAAELSLQMSTAVARQVIGLTNSIFRRGLPRRIDRLLGVEIATRGWRPWQLVGLLRMQLPALAFFLLDVLPAIRAGRRRTADDMIGQLLIQRRNLVEVLTECILFAVAAILTTREFICLALWHLLDRPALADRYRVAGQGERFAILHEILRLEPVVGHLHRRAAADIPLDPAVPGRVIPAGALVVIHLHDVNADPAAAGPDPLLIRPARALTGAAVPAEVMGLGDGHHRCPGGPLALQQTDILLRRLLALPGLRIVDPPRLNRNDIADSYELRGFTLAVD
jgi:cytochrome P450